MERRNALIGFLTVEQKSYDDKNGNALNVSSIVRLHSVSKRIVINTPRKTRNTLKIPFVFNYRQLNHQTISIIMFNSPNKKLSNDFHNHERKPAPFCRINIVHFTRQH
jgi:hypothetical protein